MPTSALGGTYSDTYATPGSGYLGFGNNMFNSDGSTASGYDPLMVGMTDALDPGQTGGTALGILMAQGYPIEVAQAMISGQMPFSSSITPQATNLLGIDPTTPPADSSSYLAGLPGYTQNVPGGTNYGSLQGAIGGLLDFSPQGVADVVGGLFGASPNLPLNGTGLPGLASRAVLAGAPQNTVEVQQPGVEGGAVDFSGSNPFTNIGLGLLQQIANPSTTSSDGGLLGISDGIYNSGLNPASGSPNNGAGSGPTNSDGTPMSMADYAAWAALAGVSNPTGAPGVNAPVSSTPGNLATDSGVTVMDPFQVTASTPGLGGAGSGTAASGNTGTYGAGSNGGLAPGGAPVTLPPVTSTGGGTGNLANDNIDSTITKLPPFNVNDTLFPPGNAGSGYPGTSPVNDPIPQPNPPVIDPPAAPPGNTTPPTTPNPPTVPTTPTSPGGGGGGGTSTGTSTGDRNAYLEGLAQNYAQQALAPQQLGQYSAYAPAYAAADAKSLSQYLFGSNGPQSLSGMSQALTTQGIDQNPLLQMENQTALQQLGLGGQLSASELRNVQQASRGGFAARGLDGTNASVVDEAMQTDAASRNRLLSALGIASNVQGQNQAFTNSQNAYNTSLLGLGQQQNIASNAATRAQFDPFNNYGMDLANTNYNAGQARQIAANNNSTALGVAAMNQDSAASAANKSLAGSIIGGFLGRCWIAREAFGLFDPRWLAFRDWLDTKAPQWFSDAYTKFGPEIADHLHHNPELKPIVQARMLGLLQPV